MNIIGIGIAIAIAFKFLVLVLVCKLRFTFRLDRNNKGHQSVHWWLRGSRSRSALCFGAEARVNPAGERGVTSMASFL
jgi:hypothetical protein